MQCNLTKKEILPANQDCLCFTLFIYCKLFIIEQLLPNQLIFYIYLCFPANGLFATLRVKIYKNGTMTTIDHSFVCVRIQIHPLIAHLL